jgi:hypothetical protein
MDFFLKEKHSLPCLIISFTSYKIFTKSQVEEKLTFTTTSNSLVCILSNSADQAVIYLLV